MARFTHLRKTVSTGRLLTPYWDIQNYIDHYLFEDSSGAQYRLYPQSSFSTIYTSQIYRSPASQTNEPGEAIYVYYDSTQGILHFKNGSYWVMGCTSGGTEQDAGTMYPTLIEDRNGNQITINYQTGAGTNWSNSSSRISYIYDTRTAPSPTYSFTYTPDSNGAPDLISVANSIGTTETYTLAYNSSPVTLYDPFGLQKSFAGEDELQTVATGPVLSDATFTYALDSASANPYVSQTLTTLNPGTTAQVYSFSQQVLDQYGNVTSSSIWNYAAGTPPSAPSGAADRVYANTYATDAAHMSQYLFGLLTVSTVTTPSVSAFHLVDNTYDVYAYPGINSLTGLHGHDDGYGTAFTARGNVTQTVTPSTTTNMSYDMIGNLTGTKDGLGHATTVNTSPTSNYAAPSAILPNSTGSTTPNPALDASLTTSLGYNTAMSVTSTTAPNTATASYTYDPVSGRPTSSQATTGAVTIYTYTSALPYTTTARTGTHGSKTYLDGFGRTVTVQTGSFDTAGNNWSALSESDNVYAPCACSPLGKLAQTSQPFAGTTPVWTVYSYDGLGRTLSVVAPDGASTTKYLYQGNWTTVTDPAGKWKQYQKDVFGNLVTVVEPDPANPPLGPPSPPSVGAAQILVTYYTYDYVNHLTGVSMPRSTGTQIRNFTYNTKLQLVGQTNPETGAVGYTYNNDGTLNTKTDAKGTITTYTYDQYQRVTKKSYTNVPTGTSFSNVNYYYDTDPFDTNGSFATHTIGRLAAMSWGVCGSSYAWTEEYAYNNAGQVTGKRLTPFKTASCTAYLMTAYFAYDTEGKMTSETYPLSPGSTAFNPPYQPYQPFVLNYTYDVMSRLSGVNATENNPVINGCPTPPTYLKSPFPWANQAGYNPANQITKLKSWRSSATVAASRPFLTTSRSGGSTIT